MAFTQIKWGFLPLIFFILAGISPLFADDIGDYQSSWIHRALEMQRDFDGDEPLRKATFLSTHNSFNAR